ncbi:MAG: CBS domain-containing protein [Candidatus Wallacebacter cryptica]|jgi:CBS domain-containing protein|nr:CBS domain-containing protein [Bacillota bacterium]
MTAYENSRRYLNAFIDIEHELEKIAQTKRHIPFYQLVDKAALLDPFVRDIAIELKEYGDLRNAIVHERIDDQPIAEPHEEVVRRLEAIRDLLRTPPTVGELFLGRVVTCNLDDTLREAVTRMHTHAFSKLPVYQGDRFVGILTAEAVTYWLADHIDNCLDLDQEPVQSVLKYLQNPDNYQFVTPDCPLFDVLRYFEDYSHRGKRLQAVLISDDGTEKGRLMGIITVFDLPKIYHTLDLK